MPIDKYCLSPTQVEYNSIFLDRIGHVLNVSLNDDNIFLFAVLTELACITKYSILAVVIVIVYWHNFHSVIVQQSITVYQPEVTRVAM